MLGFNNYRIDQKIQDMLNALNADFAKLKYAAVDIETSLPAATSSLRGQMIYLQKPAGQADEIYVCKKAASNGYSWVLIG